MFSPDADATLITLLTFTGAGITEPIRIADNYTGRISETDDDIMYGVSSRGNDFMFLPLEISLPTEEVTGNPRCSITIHDVTRFLMPSIRSINTAPNVLVELVLSSTPDTLEASFLGFKMVSVNYNANTITAELAIESMATEPFPQHSFTPAYFPGLF